MELDESIAKNLLVEATKLVQPSLVTPPEVLGDGAATLDLTRDFIGSRQDLGVPCHTKILGVVHGRNFEEWLQYYRVFHDELEDVSRIGIPYDLQFDVPGLFDQPGETTWKRMLRTRVRLTELLDEAGLNRKPAHLLGCVDAIELRMQVRFDWIVSNDSSTIYVTTQRNEIYDPHYGIHAQKHKIDMLSSMPSGRMELFKDNARVVRGFVMDKRFSL